MNEHDRQSVLFQDLADRPVTVAFDEPAATSNGGALLFGILDRRLRLTERLAAAVPDRRQSSKVRHSLRDLVRQRVFGLACGYPDANDAVRVSVDPVLRLLLERDLAEPIASQPTLSRFETGLDPDGLMALSAALMAAVLERHRRRLGRCVRRVTIDVDLTDDLTHGSQQLALFNTHYGGWCYLPLLAFVSFDDEPEQYVVAAFLRPGKTPTSDEVVALLDPVLSAVREHFPKAKVLVRADGGFVGPALLDHLEGEGVGYLLGMPGNSVLNERSEALLARARHQAEQRGETVALFDETPYAARSWRGNQRRVVFKAEVTVHEGRMLRDNPRYVVTSLLCSPRRAYDLYRRRGDVENRIKELKDDLEIDRTSCHSFDANQLRLILTAAAYALLQELRLHVERLLRNRPTVASLRLHLVKIGGRVVRSVRRVVIHLAQSHPWATDWLRLARACGASPA